MKKRQNKVKYLTWNSIRPKFVKKTRMPDPVKSLGYIECYSSSSPRTVKNPRILSDTTVSRFAVDLKPYWKSEKKLHSSRWSTSLLFTSFSKTNIYRKKINPAVVFSCRPFSNILKYRYCWWGLPTIWATKLLWTHIEEFSWYIWKFRPTILKNQHWNTIKTRCFWWIKFHYDLFNHLGNYRDIIKFQISSWRERR